MNTKSWFAYDFLITWKTQKCLHKGKKQNNKFSLRTRELYFWKLCDARWDKLLHRTRRPQARHGGTQADTTPLRTHTHASTHTRTHNVTLKSLSRVDIVVCCTGIYYTRNANFIDVNNHRFQGSINFWRKISIKAMGINLREIFHLIPLGGHGRAPHLRQSAIII